MSIITVVIIMDTHRLHRVQARPLFLLPRWLVVTIMWLSGVRTGTGIDVFLRRSLPFRTSTVRQDVHGYHIPTSLARTNTSTLAPRLIVREG